MIGIGEFGLLDMGDEWKLMGKITRIVSLIVGPISCLAGIFVALSFIMSKNMRYHPSFLIVLMSACESATTFYMILGSLNTSKVISFFHLDWFLYYLSFGSQLGSEESNQLRILDHNTEILCKANNLLMSVFSSASVVFNTCMCIDLILILRSPFSPHQKRNKFYVLAALLVSMLTTFFFMDLLTSPCNKNLSKEEHFQVRST